MGPDALQFYADLRRRGLEPDFVGSWRSALLVAWRRWTQQCVAQITDPDVLADTLVVSAESLVQFAMDSITVLRTATFDDAVHYHDQQLLRAVHRLMREDQPAAETSELHGYRFGVTHTAAVVWSESPERGQVLDEAVARLLEALPCRRSLVVNASSTTRWIWLATGADLAVGTLRRQVTEPTGARLAFGRQGSGIDGFRRSHREAAATQGVLIRLASPHTVARYSDVGIVDALTRDREHADEFVRSTLGDLAFADRDLRLTLLTYIQSGFSATRTAERLFAHRNTVERRVVRADALSATKLADGPAQIAAALLIRHLQDSPEAGP
ncbi:PucR family transcriptional regulator [Streptomyces sp. 2A115]|uniref:PucR family transcriptional regulator n=1 Tax=Streptomyces sp. 2A115 TaxID=3457439 RepID=UPI003FD2B9C1